MAAVMAESFDTQMLDYPTDTDFPMHGQTWTAENDTEVSMDADGLFVLNDDTESKAGDVEVDMEDTYEHHSEEYIMTDAEELESGNVLVEDHQITEDVEVLDEPTVQDEHSMPLEDHHAIVEASDSPATVRMTYEGEGEEPLVASEVPTTEVTEDLVSYAVHDLVEENKATAQVDNEATEPFVSAPIDDADASATNVPADGTSVPTADTAEGAEATEQQAYIAEPKLTSGDVESRDEAAAETNADAEASYEEAEQQSVVSDPHELGDGIYIDPPPAVLLSLPSLEATICLFNSLSSSSGSSTPVASTSKAVEQEYLVLLQEQPTLYYDPISSIFDALRLEENIASNFDLENCELALDAYDLQLVVSEDNIYSHEVTLHDMNVLHDASGLSGPLRLRLQATSPRFIVRFQALRDQLARAELEIEHEHGETYHEEPQNDIPPGEDANEEQQQQDGNEQYEQNENDTEPVAEEPYEEQPQEEETEAGQTHKEQDATATVTESEQRDEAPEHPTTQDENTHQEEGVEEADEAAEISTTQDENTYQEEGNEEPIPPTELATVSQPAEEGDLALPAEEPLENDEDGTETAELAVDEQTNEEEGEQAVYSEHPEEDAVENVTTQAEDAYDEEEEELVEETYEEPEPPVDGDDAAEEYDATEHSASDGGDDEVAAELLPENDDLADFAETVTGVAVEGAPQDESLSGDWDEFLEEAETTMPDDEATANGSSVTLSTKRSFDDFEEDNDEELQGEEESASRPISPDSKRLRVQ